MSRVKYPSAFGKFDKQGETPAKELKMINDNNRLFKKWVNKEFGKRFKSSKKAFIFHGSIVRRDF